MKKLIAAVVIGLALTGAQAMTITDNFVVWECSHCGAKAVEEEIASYNTFGATSWSDCFMIAPMAPTQHMVARCWKCKKAFCQGTAKYSIVNCEKVAPADRKPVEWIGDYAAVKEVLDAGKGKLDPKLECDLRMRMLWATNNKERKETLGEDKSLAASLKVENVPAAEVRENMVKLSTSTWLPPWLRVEVLREMGDFAAAKKMLDEFAKSHPDEFKEGEKYFKGILSRIEKKDARVFKR